MITRRTLIRQAGASLIAAPLASPFVIRPALAASEAVAMASWGGAGAKMWREHFLEPWSKATGIQSVLAEVPDPSAAVVAANGRPQYNVAIAASYQAAKLASLGLIEELTPDDIPNIRNIDEKYWVKSESGALLGMPSSFIYYGIAYNTKMAKAADFASWKGLADPALKGKISITRPVFLAPYDMTLYSHISGGTEADITPGLPLFKSVAANALTQYTSMASLQQQLSLGEVVAAPFYSGQIQMLRKGGETEVDIVLPEEGGLVLSYLLTVPKGAPSRDAAIRFINDCISPEKQIAAARSGYLPLTKEPNLPDDVKADLSLQMEEVRARNYAPNWVVVTKHLDDRIRQAEQILQEVQ